MKYIRKTVSIILVIIFFIALAISAAVATMVKNTNFTFYAKTGSYTSVYDQTLENLQNLKGKNIFLIDEDDVLSCIPESYQNRFNLVSYEKTLPCTVNVAIEERVETYYSLSGGVCSVYDEEGLFMFSSDSIIAGSEDDGYVLSETADGSPNVIIEDGITQAERTFIAGACKIFKENFGSLRGLVKSVSREKNPEYEYIVFVLRSGVSIEISNCDSQTEEKIVSAYSLYATLSDGQKISGKIRAYTQENSDGTIKCDYIP